METEARARGVADWARGRALGDSVSGRGVAAVRVPSAYTRIAPRSVNAGAHRASAQREILIGSAAIKNARNSPENNALNFSNRLKTANCSARFSQARRITHRFPTPFLIDTNKPHKIIIRRSALLKTKEKQFSIQYKFAVPRNARSANNDSRITSHKSRITPLILAGPSTLRRRRMQQRLHHHAILLGFLAQRADLFRSSARRSNIKVHTNVLEPHRHFLGNAERPAQIQIPFHRHLNPLGGNVHSRGHHLASNLRASSQSPKQQVTGTSARTRAPHSLMRLGLMDSSPNIHRARNRRPGLRAFRPNCNPRSVGVRAVLLLQRFLQRSKIHNSLFSYTNKFRAHMARLPVQLPPDFLEAGSMRMLAWLSFRRMLMPKYVIERDVPGAGDLTDAQLREMSQTSVGSLRSIGPQIQWLHSYVTGNKVYCVYLAPDEATVQEHAKRAGLPCNRVSAVRRLIDPTTAE